MTRGADAGDRELARLRQWLWQGLGPVRDDDGLRLAQARIGNDAGLAGSWQGRLALAMLDAALRQRGNRGAHHRSDATPAAAA